MAVSNLSKAQKCDRPRPASTSTCLSFALSLSNFRAAHRMHSVPAHIHTCVTIQHTHCIQTVVIIRSIIFQSTISCFSSGFIMKANISKLNLLLLQQVLAGTGPTRPRTYCLYLTKGETPLDSCGLDSPRPLCLTRLPLGP